jgi:predicted phage-related endonuclease
MNENKTQEQPKEDLVEILNNVMQVGIYRNVIVTKIIGGYMCLNKKCRTPEEVDKVISDSMEHLQNSIVK